MRSIRLIVISSLLLGAVPALAQPQPEALRERRQDRREDRRDRREDRRDDVQDARSDHRERMDEARRDFRDRVREDRRDGRGLTPGERRDAVQDLREERRESREELRDDVRDAREDAREDRREVRVEGRVDWNERRRVRGARLRDRAAFDAMRERIRRERWRSMRPVVEVAPPAPSVVVVPSAPPPPPVVRVRPAVRGELRLHAERVAELERIREMALQKNDVATARECDLLLAAEQRRHVSLMASFGVVIR
jgi:hypothetical protein